MPKLLTTEEVIARAKFAHGNKYDYSKVFYTSSNPIIVICPIHGEFIISVDKHVNAKQGCSKCRGRNIGIQQTKSFNSFVEEANRIHNDKYTYLEEGFVTRKSKIKIICPIHGEFIQQCSSHLNKRGCPRCSLISQGSSKSDDIYSFILKSKNKHNDKYDYSKSVYINSRTKLIIICPIHGEFSKRPAEHTSGEGCPKCGISGKRLTTKDFSYFLQKAIDIHGNKYSYDEKSYNKISEKLNISCAVHGEFSQLASQHLSGQGCKLCGFEETRNSRLLSFDEFKVKANIVHENRYKYLRSSYINTMKKVKIKCEIHGVFEQYAGNHLYNKHICPKCSCCGSKNENELADWLLSLGISNIELRTRKVINPYEIDIYLPDYKLGIEYNGVYWHSESKGKGGNYHKGKTELAHKNGIHLMQFWSTEWINKKEIVKSIILNKLNIIENTHYARKLKIQEVAASEARSFCNENHIHGFRGGSRYLGLYSSTELVCLMIEGKNGEMIRFVNKINSRVIGGFSRLLKYLNITFSFVDRRIFTGSGYIKNGFILNKVTPPNYYYTKDYNLLESRIVYQKHKLSNKLDLFDDTLTEVQNMINNGYDRVFDCGHSMMILQ